MENKDWLTRKIEGLSDTAIPNFLGFIGIVILWVWAWHFGQHHVIILIK